MHGDQDQTKHLVLMTEPMGKPYMLGSGVSSHDWEWKGEGIDGLIWEVKLIQFVKWWLQRNHELLLTIIYLKTSLQNMKFSA